MSASSKILGILILTALTTALLATPACTDAETSADRGDDLEPRELTRSSETGQDAWTLWTAPETLLRGANLYQRRVYPEIDGTEFLGAGPVGPPYSQADFDLMAEWGANYVNISYPGPFTEDPPYEPDPAIVNHLDNLLDKIARADMFAVIAFRAGPGRSEFTFNRDEVGTWFQEEDLDETVWTSAEKQEAWAEMWRYVAERYRDDPIVVGYDLMVEPNSDEAIAGVWEPEEFYAEHEGSLLDWNQFHPRLTSAIREVDTETPILIGGQGYSGTYWLPYLESSNEERVVYTVHQYAPHAYVHQQDPDGDSYPGEIDIDYSGETEMIDAEWLDDVLAPVDEFEANRDVPVAINEFGICRWQPGAATYIDDQMTLFEKHGWNHAIWMWEPSWEPWSKNDTYDFRAGADPENHDDIDSEFGAAVQRHWALNRARPSNW